MTIGRPPKDPQDKKVKLNVSIDREIYDFLNTLENRSDFINRAARSRMKSLQRKKHGKAAGNDL